MKAEAVAPDRREARVADRVKAGIDVMICHPRLVQTGLDLIDFPTLSWFETDYLVYAMRQASRRSWRIGQTRPVKLVFMAYRNTLQADALKLVAKKLQSSLAVEGKLPEDYPQKMVRAEGRRLRALVLRRVSDRMGIQPGPGTGRTADRRGTRTASRLRLPQPTLPSDRLAQVTRDFFPAMLEILQGTILPLQPGWIIPRNSHRRWISFRDEQINSG